MASMHDEVSTSIIKSDRIGRAHYSDQYKREVLTAFEQSSLSGPIFAKQCGIKYPTFASWIFKSRKTRTTADPAQHHQAFIVAELGEDLSASQALEVKLPGGALVRASSTHHVRLLAELLRSLA